MKRYLIGLLLVGCQSPSLELTEEQWQLIAQENSQLSATEIRQTAQIIPLSKQRIWIDFNHDKLCGMHHCLYAIYQINHNQELELQWRSYLDPMLPPDVSLMTKGNNDCLLVHQYEEESLKKYELCPQTNGQFQITQNLTIGD